MGKGKMVAPPKPPIAVSPVCFCPAAHYCRGKDRIGCESAVVVSQVSMQLLEPTTVCSGS